MNASMLSRLLLGFLFAVAVTGSSLVTATTVNEAPCKLSDGIDEVRHGGGLNSCGCHFNRKTGECHCHRAPACGC